MQMPVFLRMESQMRLLDQNEQKRANGLKKPKSTGKQWIFLVIHNEKITGVVILHDQVLEIVVADLMAKYKACKRRNDGYAGGFAKPLRLYLDDEEFAEIEEI